MSPAVLKTEITHGLWIMVHDKECFLSYEDFSWFLKATLEEILEAEEISPGHLYWPRLDVDLSLKIIEYPLKAKQ